MSIKALSSAGILIIIAGCTDSPAVLNVGPPGSAEQTVILAPQSSQTKDGNSSAKQYLDSAREAATNGDLGVAASFLEQAIKVEPKNRDALRVLAAIDIDRGNDLERPRRTEVFLRGAEVARLLRAAFPDATPPERLIIKEAIFREACSYAATDKPDDALRSLAEAIEAGYASLDVLMHEKELESLRKLPKFQELLALAEKNALVIAKKNAADHLASNESFEFDFQLPDLENNVVALAKLRGKVVLVDIWGTWCPPCRKEIPHLVELYKKLHGKGLEIVGMTFEKEKEEEAKGVVKSYAMKAGIPYTLVLGNDRTMEKIKGFGGFPTALFIDRKGAVRARLEGFDPEQILEFEVIIDTLLAEEPAPAKP